MAKLPYGLWEGSVVTEGHIEYVPRTRKLLSEEVLKARIPGGERAPKPRDGERVVFGTHFHVGFGLPVTSNLRCFLNYYGLQMHHLGVNSVLYIACLEQ
ncbi:retrotransposon unclassified [Hordeum vulgare]|nr:retrotransposon unclassified [Hordeum vulgare]